MFTFKIAVILMQISVISAHRVVPHVFVQEVKLTNTRNSPFSIDVETFGPSVEWSSSETKYVK